MSALVERIIAARDGLKPVADWRVRPALEAMAEAANTLSDLVTITGCASMEEVIDRVNIGTSLLDEIASLTKQDPWVGWMPNNDPAEIIFDMVNHYEDCLRSSEAARVIELEDALRTAREALFPSNSLAGDQVLRVIDAALSDAEGQS